MKNIKKIQCIRQKSQSHHHQQEYLLVERALQIIVNQQEFSITMQTPGDERYLVRGLLFAEGITASDFLDYTQEETPEGTLVKVKIICQKALDHFRTLSSTSSCGLCGRKSLQQLFESVVPVSRTCSIDAIQIANFYQNIAHHQTLFSQTGGCHAAAALHQDGKLLCVFEDIGRHNAVDKVIGYLLANQLLNEAMILTVSGRVSFEIIQKCSNAGIPILTAISAPSSLAVEMAEKANITLAAFCREERASFYSGLHRICI